MTTHADTAAAMLQQGFNCAQAVLTCCGGPRGLPREIALRVAGPLGAGMGRMGEVCGAVTGAFMAIGLEYAKLDPDNDGGKQKGYDLVQQFAARFKQRHGTICCRELLGRDISTPQGMQQARESGVFETLCPGLVRDAVEIVEALLASAKAPADGPKER